MSNLFVLNLAAADTLVSLAIMPVTFLNIASSTWTFSSKVCGLFGFVTIASFISSVSSLGLIAINRYFCIVKWQTYERTFTTPRGSLLVGLVWTMSLALASPPLLGWAEYRFISGKSICFVYWQSDVFYDCYVFFLAHYRSWPFLISRYYHLQETTKDDWPHSETE